MTAPARGVALALAALAVAGCGPKPRVHFADSPAFHEISGRVHAILQRDLDGDGLEDAVVAERRDSGFSVAVLRQEGGERPSWRPACGGEVVEGDDLDAFRWLSFGETPTVFVLVLKEDPEELVQSLAVVDAASCTTAFSDRITLERVEPDVLIAPAGLRGGAAVSSDGGHITIVDDPQIVSLASAGADLQLVTAVRVREITPGEDGIYEDESWRPTVARLALEAWRDGAAEVPPPPGQGTSGSAPLRTLPELADGRDATSLVATPGERVSVTLTAPEPIAIIELHHGCAGASAAVLTLGSGGETFALGSRPGPGSFVRGAGATQEKDGVRRDLLALETPAPTVLVALGPDDVERCLHEVRGYALVPVTPELAPAVR